MNLHFKTVRNAFILGTAILLAASCGEKNKPTPPAPDPTPVNPGTEEVRDFQLAYASGSSSQSQILLQGVSDITKGVISFQGKGYNMSSSRTARIYMSSDGKTVYSLNYTVGDVQKLEYQGGGQYTKIDEVDSAIPLGVKTARFTKLNDEEASLHYIKADAMYGDKDKKTDYQGHKMVASIGILDLKTMTFKPGVAKQIEVKLPESLTKEGYYIGRIDCPVLSNGKLYYGARVSKADPSTGKSKSVDKALTLVVDYNDLTKVTAIEAKHVIGDTNGYRTPSQNVNEAGEILQLVVNAPKAKKGEKPKGQTYIAKLKDGKYDESFVFDLNKALGGKQTSSNGWFYAGNGIGYVPYQKLDEPQIQIGVNPQGEKTFSSDWGLARVDLNNGTAVDLETPKGLWLQQYQTSVVRNGIFYIALAPVSGNGHIYAFEVNSPSPKGKKGAEITSGADQYYIGIY